MKTNLKRILPLFALASCLTTTSVFAYEDDHNQHPKAQHAVAPAKNPGGEDALAFYISAAYTYWVPYQEGLNIASSGTEASPSESPVGDIVRPAIQGWSGFKVGIGANTMHDGWMVGLNYVWFNNASTMKNNTLVSDTFYIPTWTTSGIDNQLGVFTDGVTSKWSGQFNRIDGQLDRCFYAGHYLTFRPWLGLLGAWETQNFDFNLSRSTAVAVQINNENKQEWWGIGPYAGCEASYYFTNEWAGFITSGAALLLANHQVTQKSFSSDATPTNGWWVNQKDNFNNVEPMVETSLGLRWDSFWTEWALCIDLAWEMQTYFSRNGFQPYTGPTGLMGNYSMQGVTLGAKVSF